MVAAGSRSYNMIQDARFMIQDERSVSPILHPAWAGEAKGAAPHPASCSPDKPLALTE